MVRSFFRVLAFSLSMSFGILLCFVPNLGFCRSPMFHITLRLIVQHDIAAAAATAATAATATTVTSAADVVIIVNNELIVGG